MTKSILSLVDDIKDFLSNPRQIDPKILEEYGQSCSKIIDDKLINRPKGSGSSELRMSQLGNPNRQLWYKVNQPETAEELPPETYLKFLYGDLTEEQLLFLAKATGHKVELEQYEVEIEGVKGHIDCIIDGVLVDIKSASTFQFKKFKDNTIKDNDAFGYIDQINSYLYALQDKEELKVKKQAAFLAFDKTLGHITLCMVDNNGKDYGEIVRNKKEMLSNTKPPERCFLPEADGKSGNLKLGINCSYCAFKKQCYPNLRTFLYSSGPRFLTHVAREPDVKEVNE